MLPPSMDSAEPGFEHGRWRRGLRSRAYPLADDGGSMTRTRPPRAHRRPTRRSETVSTLVRRRPRISVIVPALNEEAMLGACLHALRDQTYPGEVEIIVVDNGSIDHTAEVAAAHDAIVLCERRSGVCSARQCGLMAATGEVVVSTDADTTFAPSWLATIESRLAQHPEAVGVAGPCVFVDGPWWGAAWTRVLFGPVALIARVTQRTIYVSAANLAYRRDAFDGYDARLTHGGDELDVLRRLRRRGRVLFDSGNPVFTSSRRLNLGLIHSLVVSLGYHYLLGYVVNRVTQHPVVGSAPQIRAPRTLQISFRPPAAGVRMGPTTLRIHAHR